MGVASQEATRKLSEGRATAQVEIARAEKASLDAVADAITADGCSQTEFMISQRYNELFRSLVMAPNKTSRSVVYLPYEVSSINGLIGGLPRVYGALQGQRGASRAPATSIDLLAPGGGGGGRRGGGAGVDRFDDLS
jgi:hypothetical protein